MKKFRITKYNPLNRNDEGCYLKDEWTSISDIGKKFEGIELKEDEYLKTESVYISAIELILKERGIKKLFIADLEKNIDRIELESDKLILSENDNSYYNKITEGFSLEFKEISTVLKLALRETIWCLLYSTDEHFIIKFGFDYYIYITCESISQKTKIEIERLGLYIEELVLP